MKANMHIHSRLSDGTLWPHEIFAQAKLHKIELLSLTDHDTMSGSMEIFELAKKTNIQTVFGVEIDCVSKDIDYKSEILGYFPHNTYENTEIVLEKIKKRRFNQALQYLKNAELIYTKNKISFQDMLENKIKDSPTIYKKESFSINKVDVYNYFVSKEIVKKETSYKEFKKTFFDTGLLYSKKEKKESCETLIHTIIKDNGFAVLPHIGHEYNDSILEIEKNIKQFEKTIEYFYDLGVRGLEIYYYLCNDRDKINNLVRNIAKKMNMFLTYGTDCHGPNTSKYTIDKVIGEFNGFPNI